jgi:hypothetical protein
LPGKIFQRLSGVVLSPVEAPVDERLRAEPQWVEKGGDREGGGDHGQGGLLACKQDERPLREQDGAEVDHAENQRQDAVDEGAVDETVLFEHLLSPKACPGRLV